MQVGRLGGGQVQPPARPRAAACPSACRRRSRPSRSRTTPACRDMAAARAGRTAGFTPGRAAGAAAAGRAAPAASRPSRSPARRPVIRASVRELDARRLAPCTPVDAASPTAYRPGDRGPPVHAGPDAAARVVRAGRDRDRLGRPGRCRAPGTGGHRGEIPFQHGAAQRGGVQPQVIARPVPAGRICSLHGRRHDVPGGQVAERMAPGHDRPARRVDQHRAGPAQRLGDQRALAAGRFLPQHRRVELHELHVPQFALRRGRPAPGRRRSARPGWWSSRRPGRSRRWPGRPRRGRHRARPAGPRPSPADPGQHPADRAPLAGQGVQRDAAGQDLDRGWPAGRRGAPGAPPRRSRHLRRARSGCGCGRPPGAARCAPAGHPRRPAGRSRRAPRRPASPRRPDRTGRRPRPACPAGAGPGCPPGRWPRPGRPGPAASRPRRGPSLLSSSTRRP